MTAQRRNQHKLAIKSIWNSKINVADLAVNQLLSSNNIERNVLRLLRWKAKIVQSMVMISRNNIHVVRFGVLLTLLSMHSGMVPRIHSTKAQTACRFQGHT